MKYLENFFKSTVGSHIKSFDVIVGETTHKVMFKSDVIFSLVSQYGLFGSAFVDTSWGERIIFSRASNMRTIDNPPFITVNVDSIVKDVDSIVKDVDISVEHNEYRVFMVLDDNKEISIILRDPISLEMNILDRMNKEQG